jgi:hypothetical protein
VRMREQTDNSKGYNISRRTIGKMQNSLLPPLLATSSLPSSSPVTASCSRLTLLLSRTTQLEPTLAIASLSSVALEDEALGCLEALRCSSYRFALLDLSCCCTAQQFACTTHVGLHDGVGFGVVDALVGGTGGLDGVAAGLDVALDCLCAGDTELAREHGRELLLVEKEGSFDSVFFLSRC